MTGSDEHERLDDLDSPEDCEAPVCAAPVDDAVPALSTRTRAGQLLRDVARQLDEALVVLADEPSRAAAVARARLEAAREAVALLALERATPALPSSGADPPQPVLVRRALLEPDPLAPEAARSFCRDTCGLWSVGATAVNAVIDIASELVANAVRHASAPVVLALEREPDGMRVSAWDDGPGRPRVLPYRPGISERGLGLRLVIRLSEQWGCSEDQDGKWVWARVRVPGPQAPVRAPGATRRSV